MQGNRHYEGWKDYFDIEASKLVVTGNPKLDLFASPTQNQSTVKRNRLKILFCTMSGNVNPQGRSFTSTMEQTLAAGAVGASKEMISELAQLMTDSTCFELTIIPQLIESIKATSRAFPDADVIVRPHPIEDSSLWTDRFSKTGNVRVETRGALTEWLAQCDVLIHVADCGSGVEAALHGIPTIRFVGDGTASDPDVGLSSEINIAALGAEEVVPALKSILLDDRGQQAKKPEKNLSGYLHHPDKSHVADIVAQVLKNFHTAHEIGDVIPLKGLKNLRINRTVHFDLKPFHLQKIHDTPASEMRDLVQSLRERFGYSVVPNAEEIEDGLFLLSPP